MAEVIVIRLPYESPPIRSNMRLHWAAKAKLTKEVRRTAALCAKRWDAEWPEWGQRNLPIDKPCSVTIIWEVTDRRHRDVGASTPTLKAALDGLVDAGILRADDHSVVREERYRIEVGSKRGLRVEIERIITDEDRARLDTWLGRADAPQTALAAPLSHEQSQMALTDTPTHQTTGDAA